MVLTQLAGGDYRFSYEPNRAQDGNYRPNPSVRCGRGALGVTVDGRGHDPIDYGLLPARRIEERWQHSKYKQHCQASSTGENSTPKRERWQGGKGGMLSVDMKKSSCLQTVDLDMDSKTFWQRASGLMGVLWFFTYYTFSKRVLLKAGLFSFHITSRETSLNIRNFWQWTPFLFPRKKIICIDWEGAYVPKPEDTSN